MSCGVNLPSSVYLEVMKGEKIELDGKVYLSSTAAAKKSGYTKDYIGQLARAGKLDAQLIGRSWYIEEGSLKSHKKSVNYTLTKPKKKRAVSRDTGSEKTSTNKDISSVSLGNRVSISDMVAAPANPAASPSGGSQVRYATPKTTEVLGHGGEESVHVPIRYGRGGSRHDLLADMHVEYEPGEPIEVDDTTPRLSKRVDSQRDSKGAGNVVPVSKNTAQVSPSNSTFKSPASAARDMKRPQVQQISIDGVSSPREQISSKLHVANGISVRSGNVPREERGGHDDVGEPKEESSFLLWLLIVFVLVGIGFIVWFLFGV